MNKLTFIFSTMIICYSIGSFIMCVDLLNVKTKTFMHEIEYKWEEKRRFYEWNLGNGYVSPIENAVMLLSLFFGYMRTIDLFREFKQIEKERRWLWFWNLCEGKENENNYW